MSASKGERIRLTLRLPWALYHKLSVLQETTDVSINDLIVQMLADSLKRKP
jgi:hypothetical protein